MGVSLTVRWVFGYHDPTGEAFGLAHDEYDDVLVEAVECMGGDSGSLIFATASEVRLLNDRDGYEFDHPVFTINDLPPTEPFVATLKDFLEEYVPEASRPKTPPKWILHTDCG